MSPYATTIKQQSASPDGVHVWNENACNFTKATGVFSVHLGKGNFPLSSLLLTFFRVAKDRAKK